MKPFFLLTFSLTFFLSGCENERIIDKVQTVETLGYDMQEDKVKGIVIWPTYEEKGTAKSNSFKTVSDSYEDILPRINSKSEFPIEIGKLDFVLFGKEFAKKGIDDVITNLSRDPIAGSRMQIVIAENTAEEIINSSKKLSLPFHLSNKINHNIEKGNLPKTNLHLFMTDHYSEGKDPYLPYLILEEGQIKIGGLALLKEGKFVHNINLRESFFVKILHDGTAHGQYYTKIKVHNKEVQLLLRNLDAKAKYAVDKSKRDPRILIDLTIDTEIKISPSWFNLNKHVLELEQVLNEQFNEEVERLVLLFQEYNIDPLGLGEKVRATSRNWDYQRFKDIYPDIKTTVHTNVNILNTGIVE
ncbi:Ger(x)C family spore germination protein [Priestia megaterium]|nr:Ger(x)C family spore germination protein [Priestia megaterium]